MKDAPPMPPIPEIELRCSGCAACGSPSNPPMCHWTCSSFAGCLIPAVLLAIVVVAIIAGAMR